MTQPARNLPAMILAAGRGERLRPLTDRCPKPLLPVRGRPMIEWHLLALAAAGVREVVVNTAWLAPQFPDTLGDGSRFGLQLHWSHEGARFGGALDTAGGIATARPWLGDAFWVVSGDIVAPGFGYDAGAAARFVAGDDDAHLWLVPNPDFHPAGDFDLCNGRVRRSARPPYTYANVALVRDRLVSSVASGTAARLGPLLHAAAEADRLAGQLLEGPWFNIGTAQELARAGG